MELSVYFYSNSQLLYDKNFKSPVPFRFTWNYILKEIFGVWNGFDANTRFIQLFDDASFGRFQGWIGISNMQFLRFAKIKVTQKTRIFIHCIHESYRMYLFHDPVLSKNGSTRPWTWISEFSSRIGDHWPAWWRFLWLLFS